MSLRVKSGRSIGSSILKNINREIGNSIGGLSAVHGSGDHRRRGFDGRNVRELALAARNLIISNPHAAVDAHANVKLSTVIIALN